MRAPIRNPQIAKLALCAVAAATLAACGGGNSPPANNNPPVAATPTTLSGTVAVGRAISGANVTITDATGKNVTATSDINGNYQVPLAGLTAPFIIFAADGSGIDAPLASVVASVSTGSSAPVIANVTTLTTAVAALVTESGNPFELSDSKKLSSLVTPSTVAGAVKTLNTALSGLLSANNVDSKSFDPIATPFSADQTGADAVIDAVQVVPATGSSGGLQLISNANPNSTANLVLNTSASVTAPLPVPPMTGNLLGTMFAALTQCLAGSSASCSQAVDSNYRENGFTSFANAHPSLTAPGVSLRVPKILEFIPGTSGKQALIALPYTSSGGASGFEYTVAQQIANGWNIIGNQQQYDVTVQSFIQRRITLDKDVWPSNVSRYESGIQFNIRLGSAGTPNPASLASASVTGPGITGTIYYVLPAQAGTNLMSIARAPQAAIPTGGLTSNTQAQGHRWSWQTLPGTTVAFQPSAQNLGQKYEAQPIDVSTVPEYATYTVTFYDASGAKIGQTSVINPTPNIAASNGPNIPWQTASNDTVNSVLSPNGSQAGILQSANVFWSNLVNGANVAPLVTQAELTSQGSAAGDNVVGLWTGPATFAQSGLYAGTISAGVDQTGTQTCSPACPYPALTSGITRNFDLLSYYGPISIDAHWNVTQ
ncbi:carboxypeptidase-like regulatory domain-containing protein [Paraburkholderia strydomiana]